MSAPQSLNSSQLPELNLDTIKAQNGFQKMKKSSYYGTTHQKIEITKDQLYNKSTPSPISMKFKHKSSDSVGSNGSSSNLNNMNSPHHINSPKQVNSPKRINSHHQVNSPRISDQSNIDNSKFSGKVKIASNFSDIVKSNSTEITDCSESQETSFFKKNELFIRDIIQTISNEISSYHSELKQYLSAYGMSGEIFTFYLNRFLELSCGKEGLTQLFFKINDIIYYKVISLLQNNGKFIPILERLELNKHLILPKTLLEQICTKDLLKSIIQKISEEAKNSTYMSEYFTSDKQINTDTAIQILEDAFAGDYTELQNIVNALFGKTKFTHVFFYFFKNSVQNVLKKQGIPKVLIQKILEKIESFRYLLVENHECIEFKNDIEKCVIQTLTSSSLTDKIPRLKFLNEQQLVKLSKAFVKNLIFQPEIQILRKHVKALIAEGSLQVILIDALCASISQCLQKKDIVEESIHELSIRKEKLLLSLELPCCLIQDINDIKELIDMIKKGVKKEKHMIDDQKILENPIMIQGYLESLNSPYNCNSIKDWVGSVQLGQVTSWQIGVWFRILKTSLAKLKFNHHTQFILEQDINYISNYQ